ncbi:iron ABC transporter permease [Pseudomonas sp. 43A]|uniref:FecCD family ABC transporter permease n=1 Tax=unclassified Pseudomonas TaxID=196821 RepID=UPI001587A884|nr:MULTISPECIES: iron ABC transporter permease [unclassified Pseudomonas]QKV63333.1 iron ABC transporter permease [Pseudomonas sp. 43A]QMW08527.1 iron ABC transporter permease [Pseudomonas sp. 29A]
MNELPAAMSMPGTLVSPSPQAHYAHTVWRRSALLTLLLVLALAAFTADLIVGSGTLTLGEAITGLLRPDSVDSSTRVILWELRMPMTLMAVLAGTCLSLSGLMMQSVLDNPLAEPFTLGISSAAGFGASLALAFNLFFSHALPGLSADLIVTANAFLFSLMTVAIILLLTRGHVGLQAITLLGIAMHFVFNSLLGMAQYVASTDQLQSIVFWLMGSLLHATWNKVTLCAVIAAIAIPVVLLQAWALTALRSFGEQAVVFGIPVRRLRTTMLVLAALLAGAVTSVVGVIGFVGLVAPHVARLLVGEDQRFTIGVTIACGIIFVTLASLASKLIVPGAVLPIGMVTSLIGLPFFIILILRDRRLTSR